MTGLLVLQLVNGDWCLIMDVAGTKDVMFLLQLVAATCQ